MAASFFLRYYERRVYNDLRKIVLLSSLVCLGALGLKVGYSFLGVPLSPSQLGYLATLWIALPAMLAAVLVNVDSALLISTLLAVTAGVAWEIEARYLALALVGALVGIYGVSRIRDRNDLMRVAATISLTNVFLVAALGLLYGDAHSDIWVGMAWVAATGVGSALLFWLFVAALERPFGLVTHIGLLELSDMNRELLRRLQWDAPGTYHHSLGVAVLAEAAAEGIGADPLLARVAAYYHDIGKMRRPQYFSENQSEDNVHDNLAPSLSTIAITSHVKDGMELARQYHLPPQVRDGIVQHHGTSLVSFFYHQATDGDAGDDTLEQQFRYEGPKPQNREMAVLMLADSVEAVSRTVDKPTPQRLEQIIESIIQAKLADGQFDECDLTFRDIGGIKAAFVRTLVSMLHTRIEYPGTAPAEEGSPRNGNENDKTSEGANGDHRAQDASGANAVEEASGTGRSSASQ
jgi:putative nucleotidyltransferase with HDIG domain